MIKYISTGSAVCELEFEFDGGTRSPPPNTYTATTYGEHKELVLPTPLEKLSFFITGGYFTLWKVTVNDTESTGHAYDYGTKKNAGDITLSMDNIIVAAQV